MPVSGDGILEATFDPAWAAVRLIVDGGMWPDPVTSITITRTVAGDPTVPVRGVEARRVVGGYYIGTDHEGPLDSTVTYAVTGFDTDGDMVATASVAVDTTGAADGLWLKVAGQPDVTVRARVRAISSTDSATIGGVYQIAGGGGAVAQTTAQWSGIESDRLSVVVSVDPIGGRARLRAALAASRVLLLHPAGTSDIDPGWYFVEAVRRSNPAQVEAFPHRWFELDVQRVGVPAGQGSGIAGWSWAGVTGTFTHWGDGSSVPGDGSVMGAKPDWFSLLKGA